MEVYVTVKQAGRRRAFVARERLVLPRSPLTLRDLLQDIVRLRVDAYNGQPVNAILVKHLTPDEIEEQWKSGRVAFGRRRNAHQADPDTAAAVAVQAFADGLYRVFADDRELTELDGPLALNPGVTLVFVRFTMLAGRQW